MDPITLIMSALIAGVAEAVKPTAGQAVKDSYTALKSLLQRRFTEKSEAEVTLAQYEQKPQVWEEPLKDALITANAGEDEEIVEAARKLLSLLRPEQAAMGKYNTQVRGNVYGLAQGDNQHVTMAFSNESAGEQNKPSTNSSSG